MPQFIVYAAFLELPLIAILRGQVSPTTSHVLVTFFLYLPILASLVRNGGFITAAGKFPLVCFVLLSVWILIIPANESLNALMPIVRHYIIVILIYYYIQTLALTNVEGYIKLVRLAITLCFLYSLFIMLEALFIFNNIGTQFLNYFRSVFLVSDVWADVATYNRPMGLHGMQAIGLFFSITLVILLFRLIPRGSRFTQWRIPGVFIFTSLIIALLLSTAKTITVGFIGLLSYSILFKKNLVSVKVGIISFSLGFIIFIYSDIGDYYRSIFLISDSGNQTLNRMYEKWSEFAYFFANSLIPHGQLERSSLLVLVRFPEYADTEVHLFLLLFELGVIGVMLLLLVYSWPLLWAGVNGWLYLIFVAFIGLWHYWTLSLSFAFLLHSIVTVELYRARKAPLGYARFRII